MLLNSHGAQVRFNILYRKIYIIENWKKLNDCKKLVENESAWIKLMQLYILRMKISKGFYWLCVEAGKKYCEIAIKITMKATHSFCKQEKFQLILKVWIRIILRKNYVLCNERFDRLILRNHLSHLGLF